MKHFTILNRQGLLTRSYGKAVPISSKGAAALDGHPDPGAASKLPEVDVSFASSANGGRCNSFTQEPRPS